MSINATSSSLPQKKNLQDAHRDIAPEQKKIDISYDYEQTFLTFSSLAYRAAKQVKAQAERKK